MKIWKLLAAMSTGNIFPNLFSCWKKKFWPPATHSEITLFWRQSQVRSLLSRSAGSLLSCPQMAPMPAGNTGIPKPRVVLLGHLVPGTVDKHTSHLLSWTLTFHLHGCPIVKSLSWWPSCAHNLLDPPATLSQHPINHHAFLLGGKCGKGWGQTSGWDLRAHFLLGKTPSADCPAAVRACVDNGEFGHEVGEGKC